MRDRVEAAGVHDPGAGRRGGLVVGDVHPVDELGLAGEVDVVGAGRGAGGDQRLAELQVGPDGRDHDPGPRGHLGERGRRRPRRRRSARGRRAPGRSRPAVRGPPRASPCCGRPAPSAARPGRARRGSSAVRPPVKPVAPKSTRSRSRVEESGMSPLSHPAPGHAEPRPDSDASHLAYTAAAPRFPACRSRPASPLDHRPGAHRRPRRRLRRRHRLDRRRRSGSDAGTGPAERWRRHRWPSAAATCRWPSPATTSSTGTSPAGVDRVGPYGWDYGYGPDAIASIRGQRRHGAAGRQRAARSVAESAQRSDSRARPAPLPRPAGRPATPTAPTCRSRASTSRTSSRPTAAPCSGSRATTW